MIVQREKRRYGPQQNPFSFGKQLGIGIAEILPAWKNQNIAKNIE
jgi:hypothetical protein